MKNQLSTANMFAMLKNGKIESKIAIPPNYTFSQVLAWLEKNQYVNDLWTLDGIYEYE